MNKTSGINRRRFLQTAGTAAAIAAAGPALVGAAEPPSDPVRIAHIGTGVRGWDLIKYTGSHKGAKVVAVCDVYKPHLQRGLDASNNPEVKAVTDYRDVLADPQVEAVVIATPDHWHEQMLIDAVNAGKDVYCEKGWTTSIAAAKRMRAAVKQQGRIMQLGHQGRQWPAATAGGDLIRANRIGPLTFVKVGRYFNGTPDRAPWRWFGNYSWYDRPDPVQVRADLDWEKWLGSAPAIDFNERHFWHWRCYWPYGTGQAGDLLSHEMDFVQTVLGWGIPDTCVCAGLNAFWKDDREAPDTWLATYQFERQDCTAVFEGIMNSNRMQTPEFIGRDGRIIYNGIGQDAHRYEVYPDAPAWRMGDTPAEPAERFDPAAAPSQPTHMEDFFEAVRTRKPTRCNEDEAFIEAATLLMSVESYKQKRQVRWDKEREEIV